MSRNVLIVAGAALLSIGGIGIVVGLVWLIASRVQGALPYIFDAGSETLLYLLPALLFMISLVGAAFVASALAAPTREEHGARHLRTHSRFRA